MMRSLPAWIEFIKDTRWKLVETAFWQKNVLSLIMNVGLSSSSSNSTDFNNNQIVCYGIGSIETSRISQVQLAFLLEVANILSIPFQNIQVYDPVFTEMDIEILAHHQIQVLTVNEQCKRRISETDSSKTLFYMPHCAKAMYNNLLWANWSPQGLSRLVILGNSFDMYETTLTIQRNLQADFPHLLTAATFVTESKLPEKFTRRDKELVDNIQSVFNNTSLHQFQTIPQNIISDEKLIVEPSYSNEVELL